ncbi:MAG: glutamate synthase subunit alpha, partial [Actinomycetes bacterium]
MIYSAIPTAQGLYDPSTERDACGVAMVADIRGRRSHGIVTDALVALANLEHRGAAGAEPTSGDGAGILLQLPDKLFRACVDLDLPVDTEDGAHTYAAGMAFLPQDLDQRARAVSLVERIADEEGLEVLGWRDVPIAAEEAGVGPTALSVMPHFAMPFLAGQADADGVRPGGVELDRLTFCLRKRAEHESVAAGCGVYFPSLSARTLVYKG